MADVLRVLFASHEPRLSGAERNLVELIETLDPEAVEAHLVVPADGPLAARAAAVGATVHLLNIDAGLLGLSRWELARRPMTVVRHAWRLAGAVVAFIRLIRAVRPDIVHTASMKAHLLAAPATLVTRVPHVWHVQDILDPGWLARFVAFVARMSATRIVCLSEATAAPLRRGRLVPRVRVVYSGVSQVPADPDRAVDWRGEIGVPPDAPLVGIVGQLARWKGQDVVIAAASLVAQRVPDVRFAVVGACLFPENEGTFERSLHEAAARLDGRVVITGPVEPIEPVMAAFDVAVHASRLPEPFGRVIAEALVQGTPVVTTSIGAGRELVPPDAGRVVPPDDPAALAAAIVELLSETGPELATAAARAGARFTPEATCAGFLAVYREVRR